MRVSCVWRRVIKEFEIRHFHLFCGLGGGARGFNRGRAQVGSLRAKFRCIGGVDIDPAAVRDFTQLAGVAGTCLDLFDRQQYIDFHGHEPPRGWKEAGPREIRRAAGGKRPHIVFLSAPCKGFSGLLAESKSRGPKYQALNRLTLRGVWLMLEAWSDDPPELILFENVPRIATRGRALLDQIVALLRHYGYAVAETTHDCGEIGGLAQSRKRFLLVARHAAKVPPFLYEPPRRPLRAVGEILERMPMPGHPVGGAMHVLPNLQWKTWLRLAFVQAGSDWRSLNKLRVVDGLLADYLVMPENTYRTVLGVADWAAPAGTVIGNTKVTSGSFSVADPRSEAFAIAWGVCRWGDPSRTVAGRSLPSNGEFAVSDPRLGNQHFNNIYRVVEWNASSPTVTGGCNPGGAGLSVADPRARGLFEGKGKYVVSSFDGPANTVIAQSTTGHGAFAVADPRPPDRPLFAKYPVTPWSGPSGTVIGGDDAGAYAVADPRTLHRGKGAAYLSGGHYGVVPWESPAGAVPASVCHDNGPWSVADPRIDQAGVHRPDDKLVCVIRALDGTWHRPFTTLELAALQSLVDPEELFDLDGTSDSAKRERIGNAVPPQAAQAIADLMGETLLRAKAGETFALSSLPVWVQPVAVALSVKPSGGEE